MPRWTKSLEERLEEKFVPEPNSGCWLWFGSSTKNGYGTICVDGRMLLVHRVMFKMRISNILHGMHVLHKCDVRACCNPSHLFLGTNDDNIADKLAKGRQSFLRGENNPRAKLTIEQVHCIRASSKPTRQVAREMGVSKSAVQFVRNGKTWRCEDWPLPERITQAAE